MNSVELYLPAKKKSGRERINSGVLAAVILSSGSGHQAVEVIICVTAAL